METDISTLQLLLGIAVGIALGYIAAMLWTGRNP